MGATGKEFQYKVRATIDGVEKYIWIEREKKSYGGMSAVNQRIPVGTNVSIKGQGAYWTFVE